MAFQGTTIQEAKQMGWAVSWRTGLDLKTFLSPCRNARGGGGGGGGVWKSVGKTERCFCQAGRISFTTTGGK